jgi:hypothetical protein
VSQTHDLSLDKLLKEHLPKIACHDYESHSQRIEKPKPILKKRTEREDDDESANDCTYLT